MFCAARLKKSLRKSAEGGEMFFPSHILTLWALWREKSVVQQFVHSMYIKLQGPAARKIMVMIFIQIDEIAVISCRIWEESYYIYVWWGAISSVHKWQMITVRSVCESNMGPCTCTETHTRGYLFLVANYPFTNLVKVFNIIYEISNFSFCKRFPSHYEKLDNICEYLWILLFVNMSYFVHFI